jgi:hypothetical protein
MLGPGGAKAARRRRSAAKERLDGPCQSKFHIAVPRAGKADS